MPLGIGKLGNEYYTEANLDMPKTVWAAIAFSLALRVAGADETTTGPSADAARTIILEEWRLLHANGIVPQKPKVTR